MNHRKNQRKKKVTRITVLIAPICFAVILLVAMGACSGGSDSATSAGASAPQASQNPASTTITSSAEEPTSSVAPVPEASTTPSTTTTTTAPAAEETTSTIESTTPISSESDERPTPIASVDITLDVLAPLDGDVVTTGTVEVIGKTLPTVVASVNGQLVSVAIDGTFSAPVILEEGPNVIEVVASDIRGNEVGEVLMVMYLP